MARGTLILADSRLRALMACLFLLLAAWQPGLAAAAATGGAEQTSAAVSGGHQHEALEGGHEDHHADNYQQGGTDQDHHQPASMDICCEMHCVMSQAMPAAAPLLHMPVPGGFRADFTHALPDDQTSAVIKPPRTTS